MLRNTFKRNPICPNCREFVKRPSKKITTEEWVNSVKDIHPEYSLDKVNYVNNHTPIIYTCPKHGDKTISPKIYQRRLYMCPDCKRELAIHEAQEEKINALKQIHPEYIYDNSVFQGVRKKITVKCPKHGEWESVYDNLLKGSGCPACARENYIFTSHTTIEEFIKKANEVHNGKYSYEKTNLNERNENGDVCITCPIHGDFWQKPVNHLKGSGCRKCVKFNHMDRDEMIKMFKEAHPNDNYDYSQFLYNGTNVKSTFICHEKDEFGREHGIFEQTPKIHLRGFGCPKCSGNYMDLELFKLRAGKIHDNYYNYSNITEYVDNKTKMPIECPEHGIFMQNANSHLLGQGCPACSISHLERSVFIYLRDNNVQFVHQYRDKDVFGLQSLDFYIKSKNIGIECQGEEHFIASYFKSKGIEYAENHLKEEKERDERKRQKCFDAGIRLIYYIEPKFEKFMQPNWEYATSLEKLLEMIGD